MHVTFMLSYFPNLSTKSGGRTRLVIIIIIIIIIIIPSTSRSNAEGETLTDCNVAWGRASLWDDADRSRLRQPAVAAAQEVSQQVRT